MVDVGGMTAQPGTALGEDEEAARVVPTVSGIRAAAPDAVISVDTYRAPVAAAALDAGSRRGRSTRNAPISSGVIW